MGVETPAPGARNDGVDAVDRALAILSAFDVGAERQTLAQLAARTGFYKSTLLRLTRSLARAGYLYREPDGRFSLGAEPLRLAAIYRRGSNMEAQVREVLRELRDATEESASFYQRAGDRRVCLYREESRRAIRDHIVEGDMLALDKGAAGHVLTQFAEVSDGPDPLRPLPVVSIGERDPETAALAAPVFASSGLVGAVSISGPLHRLTPEQMAQIGPRLVEGARRLTVLLGGKFP